MKIKIKRILVVMISIIIFTSCQDFLDINENPNFATDATPELIFPSAVISTAGQIGGYYNLLGNIWSQYYTQSNVANQYKDFDSFSIQGDDLDTEYRDLFAGALNDCKRVKKLTKESENWGLYLMATVLEAYTWQYLVDYYDQLPYSQSLKGDEGLYQPEFDNGSAIYDSLIININDALSKDFSASTVKDVGNNDFVFSGDVSAWIKFANTLKLKIYLRQRFTRPEVSQNGIVSLLNDPNFLDEAANVDVFVDEAEKSNPMYESDQRKLNTQNNLVASFTTMSFLDVNDDPRLDKFYKPGSGGHVSLVQGNFDAPSGTYPNGSLSQAILYATDPVYFISEAESYFLQAEADLIYNSGVNAKSLYDQGVLAAFDRVGLDGSSFVAAGGAYEFPSDGTNEEKFESIMIQKWASMIKIQGVEAFLERTRTGYPRSSSFTADEVEANRADYMDLEAGEFIFPKEAVVDKYAKRLPYPDFTKDRNPNTPEQKPITEGVWWFMENPNSNID